MTTVPFTAHETVQYVAGQRPELIDLSQSKLTPMQVWNYLAYLKIEEPVVNISQEQLAAYLTTRDFVKSAGVVEIVKQVLFWHAFREPYANGECAWDRQSIATFVDNNRVLLNNLMDVLESLRLFSMTKSGAYAPTDAQRGVAPDVGVNFCHLFSDDLFLITLLSGIFANHVEFDVYYEDLFDQYIYGGDNLIWFVTSNPTNLFFQAFVS